MRPLPPLSYRIVLNPICSSVWKCAKKSPFFLLYRIAHVAYTQTPDFGWRFLEACTQSQLQLC